MAHINIDNNLPGIRGLMAYRPITAEPLNSLAETLLRIDDGLSKGERELIATYVSSLNDCFFCQRIHGAVAAYYYDDALIENIRKNNLEVGIDDKLKALLSIAHSVQQGGKFVLREQIENAKAKGASDIEIHDTVLIAAAFCMYNRYVDGLGTFAPDDPSLYKERARLIAEVTGYKDSKPQ